MARRKANEWRQANMDSTAMSGRARDHIPYILKEAVGSEHPLSFGESIIGRGSKRDAEWVGPGHNRDFLPFILEGRSCWWQGNERKWESRLGIPLALGRTPMGTRTQRARQWKHISSWVLFWRSGHVPNMSFFSLQYDLIDRLSRGGRYGKAYV